LGGIGNAVGNTSVGSFARKDVGKAMKHAKNYKASRGHKIKANTKGKKAPDQGDHGSPKRK
jgi:hypothetical protein